MFRKHLLSLSVISVILLMFVFSCGKTKKGDVPKLKEGEIHFEVTYPYYNDAFMASILPSEMVMSFKNNVYRNCVSQGGLFSTIIIADCNNETLIMILDFGLKKIYCNLDKALTDTMLKTYPVPDILNLDEYGTLAGVPFEKKIAIFDNLKDGFDLELFETDKLDIKNSNWCNQYNEIEGVLLGYEIEQYGIQMRMIAQKIDTVQVNDSIFMVPENFTEVPLDRMLYELGEIFKSFTY